MIRSRSSLWIFIALFVGLYILAQGNFYGLWFHLGDVGWLKWVLLAVGISVICNACSAGSRRRRARRDNAHYDDGGDLDSDDVYSYMRPRRRHRRSHGRSYNDDIQQQLNKVHDELEHLREQSKRQSKTNADDKIAILTERVENLEKIVTDRRYQLDEELRKLQD